VAWLPAFIVMLRTTVMLPGPRPAFVTINLPSGGTVEASPAEARRLEFLQRVAEAGGGAPVLMLGNASGCHLAYRVPHATRHTWFFAPEIIRPYDEPDLIASFDRTPAVISCDERTFDAGPPALLLPPAVARTLASRLEPWMNDAGCRVYRIRRSIG